MADLASPAAELDATAAALRTTFPSGDDAPLAMSLLRALADGRPVTAAAPAERTGRSPEEVAGRLDTWPNVERDDRGDVTGFAGLTLRSTMHAFEVNGRQLHTWCAWDTLFLPLLLDSSAHVRSTCPVSGTDVELMVGPRGVQHATPEHLYVTFPPLETTDTSYITGSFCCHVLFLAGPATASRWRAGRPRDRLLDVRTAFELGRRTVAPLFAPTTAKR